MKPKTKQIIIKFIKRHNAQNQLILNELPQNLFNNTKIK